MRLESVNPSLMNFLAGITTTVAVTLALTPSPSASTASTLFGSWRSYGLAAPWGLSAIFWALVAAQIQNALHEADLLITPALSKHDKDAIYKSAVDPIRFRSKLYITTALFFMAIGLII